MYKQDKLKITITKIIPVIELIKSKNININDFLIGLDIDPLILNSPDNKITLKQFHDILQKGALLTKDDLLGLHAGKSFTLMSNILGYIIMNCRTAGEALEKYIKYQKAVEDIKEINIIYSKNNIVIEMSIKDDKLDKDTNLIDYNLTGLASYFQALTGLTFPAIETHFRHPAPDNKSEYQSLFGNRLIFSSNKNLFIVPKDSVNIPIHNPNRDLLNYFEKHIYEIIKNNELETYSDKVKNIIVNSIKNKIPTLDDLSKNLSMSSRSLQNKLKHEGFTYSAILNSIRKEIAMEYLKDNSVTISEISYLLGFSEPSVFHRTFKKWTNTTPNTLRAKSINN